MAFLGEIYPHYVIDSANCTIVRFSSNDKLLTAEDAKLERLKFAISFMIADMFWVKKATACYQRIQKIRNRNLIHPSFTPFLSFTLTKFSFTLW